MERLDFTADADQRRLDLALARAAAGVSRAEIQRAIRAGEVLLGGRPVWAPSHPLRRGDHVTWERTRRPLLAPAQIDLDILFEDDDLLALHKPAGIVVHPGAGTRSTTLVEGVLAVRPLPEADNPARPGIVHRLDKETSGVLLVAKTPEALTALKAEFAGRRVLKAYIADVDGRVEEDEGLVLAPIGRDPNRPRRRAVRADGRPAETTFRVLSRRERASLLCVLPKTGRTHQIRVHLAYTGHPVRGDSLYGPRGQVASRLFLHAWRLELTHPATGRRVRFEAPVPGDFPPHAYDDVPWPAEPS